MGVHDIPDAIQWHDGLLLTAQHFQQLSSRHEALVQYSTSLVSPFCWGIRRLTHDALSLPAGIFRVTELEGLMPDGLLVAHGLQSSHRDHLLEVDLAKHAKDGMHRGLMVHVAVEASGNANGNRYQSFKGASADGVTAERPWEIRPLKPELKLIVAERISAEYMGFPLARVIKNKEGAFALDDKFIPPFLRLPFLTATGRASADSIERLAETCSEVAEHVRKRAIYVVDAEKNAAEVSTRDDPTTKSLLLSLVGSLPYFEAVLKTGVAHPYNVYLALCSMAGQVAVLGTEMVPPAFNPYNHDDLYSTFTPIIDFIKTTVDRAFPVKYKTFPFQYLDGVYQLHFDGPWTKKRLAIGIKGQRGIPDEDVIKWGESCLIGSQSKIQPMREKRIKGAGRTLVTRVGDIVPAKGTALFSLNAIEVDDAGGSFIEPDKVLQILNLEGERPAEIVLHVADKLMSD